MSVETFILGYNYGYTYMTARLLIEYDAPWEEIEDELGKLEVMHEYMLDLGLISKEEYEFFIKKNWEPKLKFIKEQLETTGATPGLECHLIDIDVPMVTKDQIDFNHGYQIGWSMCEIIHGLEGIIEQIDAGVDPKIFEYIREGRREGACMWNVLHSFRYLEDTLTELLGSEDYRLAFVYMAKAAEALDKLDFRTGLEYWRLVHGLLERAKWRILKPII